MKILKGCVFSMVKSNQRLYGEKTPPLGQTQKLHWWANPFDIYLEKKNTKLLVKRWYVPRKQ